MAGEEHGGAGAKRGGGGDEKQVGRRGASARQIFSRGRWWALVAVIGLGGMFWGSRFSARGPRTEASREMMSPVARGAGPASEGSPAQAPARSLREKAEDTELENAAFPAGSARRTEQVTQSAVDEKTSSKPPGRTPSKVTRFPREPNQSRNSENADVRSARGSAHRRRTAGDSEAEPAGMPALRSDGRQVLREVLGKTRQETGLRGAVLDSVLPAARSTLPNAEALAEDFAPYGRLIKCELVLTVDSLNLQTPIVALVMEDVWWNGKLIIPAGSEAFSKVTASAVRDRIGDDGTWTFVLPEQDDRINGRELILKGFAVDRAELTVEEDGRVRSWSLNDGSAGLHGYCIDDSDPDKIRLFLTTALSGVVSGFSEGLETREPVPGVAGAMGLTELKSTLRNASVNGASQGARKTLDALAEQILEQIKKNQPYIRVPSGKQFYVFVDQSIDPAAAQVGLRLVKNAK